MSLTLGYFSKFPAAYKDREKSIGEVRFNNINHNIIKDKIITRQHW